VAWLQIAGATIFRKCVPHADSQDLQDARQPDSDGHVCAPVRDEKGLADLITTLLADESMRQTMGTHGRKRVEEVFTAGKQIDAYLNLYHKIAGVPLPQAARVRQDASKAASKAA
jgi:spore maturation protein CgeB